MESPHWYRESEENEYVTKLTDEHLLCLLQSIQYMNAWGMNEISDTGYAPLKNSEVNKTDALWKRGI
jgi:hypothetical protein